LEIREGLYIGGSVALGVSAARAIAGRAVVTRVTIVTAVARVGSGSRTETTDACAATAYETQGEYYGETY
jgi:hypothetical protein